MLVILPQILAWREKTKVILCVIQAILTTITSNFGQILTSSHKLQIVKSFIETTIFSSFTKRFSQTFSDFYPKHQSELSMNRDYIFPIYPVSTFIPLKSYFHEIIPHL